MSAVNVNALYPIFTDIDGQPLEDGYVWIGVSGLEPQANPQTAYWDAALTLTVTQPVRTRGGYPLNGAAIGRLFTAAPYSIKVQNKRTSTIATELDTSVFSSSASVSFLQSGVGAVERTVQSKLRDSYSFDDFGAAGNDSTDDTADMQQAIDAVAAAGGGKLLGRPGATYKITAALVLKIGVLIDLCGATIKQYTSNTQIVTAPTGSAIYDWSLTNGTLRYATAQDGTSTIGVTVTGALNAGDIFTGLTSGGTGRVVSVAGGTLTYLAGVGTVASGESLSVNSATQATTTSARTTVKCGDGLRLANGAFSYNFLIDRLYIIDAYRGIVCPSSSGTFAFVGQITNYTASVALWAIDYDCDSAVGANTNVILQNCWHNHSQVPAAPFSSGFRFNACAMFRWDSLLADKIEGQFVFAQTSSGEMGTLSLESANQVCVSNLQTASVLLSDASINIDTLKFVGNSFTTYVTMTVSGVSGTFTPGQTISAAPSGARGKVVSLSGTRLTVTQNTINANFAAADALTGPTGTATVAGSIGNSGQISLFRGTSATRYNQYSSIVSNVITSGNTYAGQNIYDMSATADGVSSGPFNVYNTQAALDRAGTGVNITGTILVGDTITGASSGASGVVVAVGTFQVLYQPTNFIPWTVGENVNVLGVSQGTSLGSNQVTAYLGDFGTPPQIKSWNGIGRDVVPDATYATAPGYVGLPQISKSANYTLIYTDAGKSIVHPITDNNARTFTIPNNGSVPYPVGTAITFINLINTVTIAITTDTMYLAGAGTTGSRTLAAYGLATAVKVTATSWIISGNGLT